MPEHVPEDLPDRMPDRMSEDMPEDMPDKVPEDMPGRMPEDMPDSMPEDMPDKLPEDMSDRMPEDFPVTKRIDVMVGITRSKVISVFFSFFSFFGLRMESAVFPRRGPFYLSPAGSCCHCLMAAAPRPDSPEIQYEDDFWECLGREPSC